MSSNNEHHDHKIQIFVNGRSVFLDQGKVTYVQIVTLAYSNPDYEKHTYKVTYFRHNNQEEKSLTKGESVEITPDMSFTVTNPVRS